jgi:hypothetical protein
MRGSKDAELGPAWQVAVAAGLRWGVAPIDAAAEFGGTPRFRIARRLGAGGMGVVYEAWDQERRMPVALKTLRSMSPERLVMFKNEFRALADLAHPNLAALYELFEAAGQWFFTMELVDGVALTEHLTGPIAVGVDATRTRTRPSDETGAITAPARRFVDAPAEPDAWGPAEEIAPSAPIDPARLAPLLEQIARGLGELHRRGKVHRDIKPSNVLVTPAGRVVIVDFGLVAAVGEVARGKSFMGTPGYMAPEQGGAGWVGPAADWYAVGAILYELLAGRLPFLGSPEEVVRAKQRVAPIPPRVINPAAPVALEALCLALLRAAPERRAGAAEVLAAIGAPAAPVYGGPGFVGRSRELALLDAALAAAATGPVQVSVRGESGIGKSALVAEWIARVAERTPEVLVLAGRCYERESVPYKALDGVIDALAGHLGHVGGAPPLDPQHAAIAVRAFPALGAVFEVPARPRGASQDDAALDLGEPGRGRRQLHAAMRALIGALARTRRVVIAIDDLQWADDDGLALLAAALAPPDAPRVLVVATERLGAGPGTARPDGRAEEGARSPAAARGAAPGRLPGAPRVIEVGGLTDADARTLAGRWIADGRAGAIAAEAGGHPLFIAELARAPALAALPGARLEDALWQRCAAQPAELRALLEVVAIAGQPVRQELAAACAGIAPAALVPALAALREQSLVRTTGPGPTDAVDVYHARIRDAILAHLDDAEARARHRALALAMEARAGDDAEIIAEHWRLAGEPGRAAGYVATAAIAATAALAFDHAAALWRRALELTTDPDRAHAARLALGQALADGGRGAEAARAWQQAALDAEPSRALDLRRRAAEQLLRAGHVDEGLAGLAEVTAAVGLALPADARAALPRLLWLRARLRTRGLGLARPAAPDPARTARMATCWSAAVGLSMVDAVRGAEFQTRFLLAALAEGNQYQAALGLSLEAGHAAASGVGSAARTARVIALAQAHAEASGRPRAIAMARAAAGVAAYLEGRFAEAITLTEGGARQLRAECVGTTWERDTAVIVAAWARAYLGRLRELAAELPPLWAEAEDLGDLYLATTLKTGTLVMLPLSRGDPASARAAATEAMRRWTHHGFLHQHWDDLLGQGEIDLYEGEAAGAHRRVVATWPSVARAMVLHIQMSRCEAWSLRARSALAQVAGARDPGHRKAMIREVKAGLRALRGQAPWTAPIAQLLAAGLAAATGDDRAATAGLAAAITGFDQVGMAAHAAAARRQLGARLGGAEGEALTAAAIAFEQREGVVEPARLAAWLAPGF